MCRCGPEIKRYYKDTECVFFLQNKLLHSEWAGVVHLPDSQFVWYPATELQFPVLHNCDVITINKTFKFLYLIHGRILAMGERENSLSPHCGIYPPSKCLFTFTLMSRRPPSWFLLLFLAPASLHTLMPLLGLVQTNSAFHECIF